MNNPFFNQNNSCVINNNNLNNNINQNQFFNNMNFNPIQMNPFFFMNNMNLNLMMNIMNMNMNQMNFNNSNMNQNNNGAQFNFNNSVDLKGIKKELIDQIILFYQLKGKDYMHQGNPKQIEGLITHLTYNPKEFSDLEEPLSYIEGPTVTINFIDRNKNDFYASKYKLPKSISKFELYTIVKTNYEIMSDDFLLLHKETI